MTTKKVPAGFVRRGDHIVRAESQDEQRPAETPAAADPTCPECGAATKAGDKFCAQCGAELAAPAEGGDTPAEARAFASWARTEFGERTLDGVRGAIRSEREQAASARELGARVAFLEREQLLERAVAEGRVEPAEAWTFTVGSNGEKVRSFSEWAGPPSADRRTGQSLEQLRAYVSRREPSASVRRAEPARKAQGDQVIEEHARATGRDPERYAAIAQVIQGRQAVEVMK